MSIFSRKSKQFLSTIFLSVTCIIAQSQTIRYSRQTQPLPLYDKMQLIPGVAGKYHLLFFKNNSPVSVFIFNQDLQFSEKRELPVSISGPYDTRIIPFENFYLLYLHKPGSTNHELWQVNAYGEALSLTKPFQKCIDTHFKKNTATLQLVNQDEDLVMISHTYYDELKALANFVVKVDKSFKTISSKNISYPFDRETDRMFQAMLVGESLFILESTGLPGNFSLQIIKADLGTGKMYRKAFNSNQNFTNGASFRYIPKDSVLLIYSNLGPQVFISKLDFSLNEMGTPNLVKPRFNNHSANNFIYINGEVQQWLAMNRSNNTGRYSDQSNNASNIPDDRIIRTPNPYRSLDFGGSFANDYLWQSAGSFESNATNGNYTGNRTTVGQFPYGLPICFSVINKDLQIIRDSVVTNKKGPRILKATESANLTVGKASYLILQQEFSHGENGLMLVNVDSNHQIVTKDISVNDKFQYLLKDARSNQQEALVMPFVHKYAVGLLKLSFSGTE